MTILWIILICQNRDILQKQQSDYAAKAGDFYRQIIYRQVVKYGLPQFRQKLQSEQGAHAYVAILPQLTTYKASP